MGMAIILFGVAVMMVILSLQTHSWSPLEAIIVLYVPFLAIIFIGTRYRIFWCGGEIVQKASGMADVSIRADEITRIEQETSDAGTLVRLRRPFRRIAIYAENPHGEGKFIDVSLKHFVADDVRKLMRAIHARRPDLTLPKHWT